MSLYNLLFGRNIQSDLLLAVIGLREHDVERFRDVHASPDGKQIVVYTRTGGGNRDGYPNAALRHADGWIRSDDDEGDTTYAHDYFAVPDQWAADVAGLANPLVHGIRPEFGRHLLKTLQRTPTDGDKDAAAYEAEETALKRTQHAMANGHTFVPYSDDAMRVALEWAEKNDGKLRTCWGILPLTLHVKSNHIAFPNAITEDLRSMDRVRIDYEWVIDGAYWERCQKRFTDKYPKSMASISEHIESIRARTT